MKRLARSIRSILLLTITALTLLIAALVAKEIYNKWQQLEKIRDLKNAVEISDQLFHTTEKLSIERDIALSMLLSTDEKTIQDLKPRLAESKEASKSSFDKTILLLQKYPFPELVELHEKIKTHRQNIQTLRQQIDQEMLLPETQRNASLPQRWGEEVNLLVGQTQDLWTEFIRHFTDINPIVTQHIRFKHLIRIITDYTGRERSLIGKLIVEDADPTPAQSVELLRGQGIVIQAWGMSRLLASQSELFPDIAPIYNDAQSHYLTLRDMFQYVFYIPGARHGEPYPIDANLWFELSTQTGDSLAALKVATVKKTNDYILFIEKEAENSILMHVVLLVFACVICVYSFWLVKHRVIQPINQMIEALLATIQGKQVTFIPQAGQQDEIGKLSEVLHAFQDKMEKIKSTSMELERSENTLRLIFDHALDAIVTMDQEGNITEWNEQAEVIFGWKHKEAIGKSLAGLIIPPAFREGHRQGIKRFLTDGTARILNKRIELEALHKNKAAFPVELTVTAQKLPDGYYFTAFIRDITERKRAETNLLRYTQALEHSNRELDDFAYIASHDLKEPLRGIHNHSQFLIEDNKDKLDSDSVMRLNRLSYLSQRMEALVNDLLYFSRLGRQELAIQSTDLNEVIRDIESTLDVLIHDRTAKIIVPQALPTIVCDKPRVTEVFRNIITNAIKYNDKPEKRVEIGYQDNAGQHVFYVKDNGKGIDKEFYEEIFRIFKRLESSKDSKEDGTGVGLTFVKKIVERHGGKVWLDSKMGEGTTFYFTLREPAS